MEAHANNIVILYNNTKLLFKNAGLMDIAHVSYWQDLTSRNFPAALAIDSSSMVWQAEMTAVWKIKVYWKT